MKCPLCNKIIPNESVFCMYCGAKVFEKTNEDFIQLKIKSLIDPQLKSPASAIYNITLKETDNYGRKFYNIIVDSQNSYGAMLRNEFFVIFYNINYETQTVHYTDNCLRMKSLFMSEDAMKRLNNWNKPI